MVFDLNVNNLKNIVFDVAERNTDQNMEIYTDVILDLVSKEYAITIITSNSEDNLEGESFESPKIKFIKEPFVNYLPWLKKYPMLFGPDALWLSNETRLHNFLKKHQTMFCRESRISPNTKYGISVLEFSELKNLLNPTADAIQSIAEAIVNHCKMSDKKRLLIGIAGPPMSNPDGVSEHIKQSLEGIGIPLVEVLDMNIALLTSDNLIEGNENQIKKKEMAWNWLENNVLKPFAQGKQIDLNLEDNTQDALFLTEESFLIVSGEMLFVSQMSDYIDFSILIDVSRAETTRRIYEIPYGQEFPNDFIEQYMAKEGGQYQKYLNLAKTNFSFDFTLNGNNMNTLRVTPKAALRDTENEK